MPGLWFTEVLVQPWCGELTSPAPTGSGPSRLERRRGLAVPALPPSRCRAVAAGKPRKLCPWGAESRLNSVRLVPLAWWAPWDSPKSGGRVGAGADAVISGEVGTFEGAVSGALSFHLSSFCLPFLCPGRWTGSFRPAERESSLDTGWLGAVAAGFPTQRSMKCPQLSHTGPLGVSGAP